MKKKAASKSESTSTAMVPALASRLPEGIKMVRRITLPSLSIKEAGQERILLILDKMRVSTIKDASDQKREPATICTAGDVQSGEQFTYIVASVVKSNLERDYPNDSYVGKVFWIKNMGKRTPGQRYKDYSIAEVDASELTQKALAA